MTETMVALVDGVLERRELELAVAHASRCTTCRAILSALARTPVDGRADVPP